MARKPKKVVEKPPEKPKFSAARCDLIIAGIKAKYAQQKELFTRFEPPVLPENLTAETVIDGKPVSEWAALEEIPNDHGWAIWAVRVWRAKGCPTKSTKVLDQITKLREDAEKLVTFAALDREKATTAPATKAAKLLKAAQAKSDKAAKLFEEADRIATEHKEKA